MSTLTRRPIDGGQKGPQAVDATTLAVPQARFVQHVDVLLKKDERDRAVPWRDRPNWVVPRQVSRMADIGAGLGRFTQSATGALAGWGVLSSAPKIDLIDGDLALFEPHGVPGQRSSQEVCAAIGNTLHFHGVQPVIGYDKRNAALTRSGGLFPLDQYAQGYNLILASHVTYYFGEGDGLAFATACARYLAHGGLLWLVIRRYDCPIYQARAEALALLGRCDPKPHDYAEHFLRHIEKHAPDLRIIDNRTQHYALPDDPNDRLIATHLLMWRDYPRASQPECLAAAQRVSNDAALPFSEEHIVLALSAEVAMATLLAGR